MWKASREHLKSTLFGSGNLLVIKVLQNWQDVETATKALQSRSLPTHITIQKNWDQWQLAQLLQHASKLAIVDLGCGDCCTLDFLAALGVEKLTGIDLTIKTTESHAYQLFEGDLTATPFPDSVYDVAVSISVIEHGVDLNAFFKETYRVLKPGGLLFITTDYWQDKISIDAAIQPFGLSWQIFSHQEIQQAIALAEAHGFVLEQSGEIPSCAETPVSWYGKEYTFIALALRKPRSS